jgi:hypothetical protein
MNAYLNDEEKLKIRIISIAAWDLFADPSTPHMSFRGFDPARYQLSVYWLHLEA